MRDTIRVAVMVGGVIFAVEPARGQSQLVLEFTPTVGSILRSDYTVTGALLFQNFSSLGDSITGTIDSRVGATRRIVATSDGGIALDITVDSAHARVQLQDHFPRTFVPRDVRFGPVAYPVDNRFAISTAIDAPADPLFAVVRGVAGHVSVPLPGGVATPGDRWEFEAHLPHALEVPGDTAVTVAAELHGPASAVLDSLVARVGDTLAYVTARGSFPSRTIDTTHPESRLPAPVELWGSFVASYVWSTGWQTWVTGAANLEIHHRFETSADGTQPDPRVTATLSARFRIRP